MKRMLCITLCCFSFTLLPVQAGAQGYPSRPVKMVVGFSPGGGTDILARIVAQKLSDAWGQPVIVENRPGASATIGANLVAKAAPDGYTLAMGQLTPNAIAPALMRDLPYNATRDFVPVILVGTSPNVLVVTPSLPVKNVAELAALAKSRAGGLDLRVVRPGQPAAHRGGALQGGAPA